MNRFTIENFESGFSSWASFGDFVEDDSLLDRVLEEDMSRAGRHSGSEFDEYIGTLCDFYEQVGRTSSTDEIGSETVRHAEEWVEHRTVRKEIGHLPEPRTRRRRL